MNTLNIRPTGTRVFLIREEALKFFNESIDLKIPETIKEKHRPHQGEIKFCGPDCTFKPGEKVIWNNGSGSPVTLEGVEYLVMREQELIAAL